MNYEKLAKEILEKIGGGSNISGLTHCATRLRFNLKDDTLASEDAIKNIQGVMGAMNKGGQFQVVIGSDVASVYKPLVEMANISDQSASDEKEPKKKGIDKVIDTLTGIFTPILPAITAAGMIKAILAILVTTKVVTSDTQTYQILNFMADAAFYFLPILLASSAAKKFKCNPYLAMMLGGILLHPNFLAMVAASKESGEAIKFLGLPISNASYSSSVLPIILIVWFMSYVEPIADRVSPKAIKFFTKPLLTILVTATAGLVVIGPLGFILSQYVADFMSALNSAAAWLVPTLVGILSPLLVMTGTHYGIIPIGINNRLTLGYDTFLYPGMLASNVAQGGAALAVSLKSKKADIKQLASSAGITAVCGITEPALYGVNIRFKTPLYAAMIGGGIGGFFMGIFDVRNYSGGSPGFLTLPSYIGGDTMNSFIFACIGAAISTVVAFIVSYVLYKEDAAEHLNATEKDKESAAVVSGGSILAPIQGQVISLKEVSDMTFSDEIVGKGAAIVPEIGRVVSPVDGTLATVFNTKHALMIKAESGAEILIHIGLETVKLDGKYFEVFKKSGDAVKKGDLIAAFDIEKIKEAGYDITTPVVVTNHDAFGSLEFQENVVKELDEFIQIG